MVCTKGHTFPSYDISFKFIEWVETLRALGADVFVYYFAMHSNMIKVYDYYSSRGLLDVTHVTIPGNEELNDPDEQYNYLINIQDR